MWVAGGTYHPGKARDCSFVMKENVGLFGGFDGTETKRDGRDWNKNQTILSGVIGGSADDRDNVYHVVRGCVNAVLDGFVVRDGRADGKIIDGYGGGMINWGYEASAIVRNTVFTDNYARDGGAVFCFRDSRCYFQNVTITNNRANMGGGLSLRFGCSVRLDDCLIEGNFAEYRGGGAVVNYGSNPEFNRVYLQRQQDCWIRRSALGSGSSFAIRRHRACSEGVCLHRQPGRIRWRRSCQL